MEARGIDNLFILYGYAIFLAATEEDDFVSIKEYTYRANVAEKRQRKRHDHSSRSPISIPPIYELADVGFPAMPQLFSNQGRLGITTLRVGKRERE